MLSATGQIVVEDPRHGEALFLGKAPLLGKLRGHQHPLPAEVVRCVNCHAEDKLKLTRALLMNPRQRRGGPPSSYNEGTFCKLLRTGIDPVSIMIEHEMPTYQITPADCADLWTYLVQTEVPHVGN